MEVTKDEQRKLDELFRKIADRDEFVAQQRQAAETLRRKEAEPPVIVWAVAINGLRDQHKSEGPLEDIFGEGESTRWSYTEWDAAHNYYIARSAILSTIKREGQR